MAARDESAGGSRGLKTGAAGAGFAVVTDEVRKLVMRAAEAARNTAQLIEKNHRHPFGSG